MQSAFKIHNGLAPKQGPKALRLELDFSTSAVVEVDLFKEQEQEQIDFFQSVWADCSLFPSRIDIEIQGLPQTLKIPTLSQGMHPILCGGVFRARFTAVGGVTPIMPTFILLNVPQPYYTYLPG